MYEYDVSASLRVGQQTNYTWAVEAYGDVGDDAYRRSVHDQIVSKANALRSSGGLSDADADMMIMAADGGCVATPGITPELAADAMAKAAYYKMMADTGLMALRKNMRNLTKAQVDAAAKKAAANVALWDGIGETMEWVSGKKAYDKLAEILGNIRRSVGNINDTLAQAKVTLTPERYAKVRAEADPVTKQLTYLRKYIPNIGDEVGGLAAVQLGAAAIIAIVIGICALVYGVIRGYEEHVKSKALSMIDEQRQAEIDAAKANPNLTPEQKQAAVIAAGQRAESSREAMPEALKTKGGIGSDITMIAFAGLAVAGIIFVAPMLTKRSS